MVAAMNPAPTQSDGPPRVSQTRRNHLGALAGRRRFTGRSYPGRFRLSSSEVQNPVSSPRQGASLPSTVALLFGLRLESGAHPMGSSRDNQPAGARTAPLGGRPGFGARLNRGWREADACWALISEDPYLLILPSLSLLFVCATWAGLYFAASALVGQFYLRFLLAGLLSAYPSNFVATFLGVAFIAVADGRLRGDPTTIGQGLAQASRKALPIARWALIASGIGLLFQILQHVKADWAVSVAFAWLAGAAWAVLTFFVVPVLAFENRGARGSLRRSAQIVRSRWGEGLGGVTNLGAAFGVVLLVIVIAGALLAGIGFAIGPAAGIATLAVIGLLFAGAFAVLSTGSRLLALGLYRLATGGPLVGFDQEVLEEALIPKRSRWRPWRR
jgi:hypothetical protein